MAVSSAIGVTGQVPVGAVMAFAGSSAPANWLLCDGSAVSRTTYGQLFAAIGTTYGTGDGSTTFNLPDLRGRVPAGKDNMGGSAASRLTSGGSGITGTTLGAVGGAETHTLTTAQMPSHNHNVGLNLNAVNVQNAASSYIGTTTGNWNTQSTGGDGAHNNTQPTIVLNYIVRAA